MSGTTTGTPHRVSRDAQVATSATASTFRRRRLAVLAGLVLVVFALTVLIGRAGAEAELADPVAGHVVVAPGDTLWAIAVDTAPDGVDPRQQLEALRQLNGLESGHLDVWTVVLIPAR
jgi:Tfp pilus assembly protein FimV